MIKGQISLKITTGYDLVTARQQAGSFAEKIGFSKSGSIIVSTIISQIARRLLRINNEGRINIFSILKNNRNGIVISAYNNDQNISNVRTVYEDNVQPNINLNFDELVSKKVIDEFSVVPVSSKGINIEIVKYI